MSPLISGNLNASFRVAGMPGRRVAGSPDRRVASLPGRRFTGAPCCYHYVNDVACFDYGM